MATIDAQTLIRKADNGEQMLAFLEIIAKAAANGTLEAPEEAPEAEEEAEYDEEAEEAEYDEEAEEAEYDDERLEAEIDF